MSNQSVTAIGIDTSHRVASIALSRGEVVASRELGQSGRRHARTLVPELKNLLDENDTAISAIDVVGVTIGPGSFTGLRVGVACAKALCWSANVSLVGVNTFDMLAEQFRDGHLTDTAAHWLAVNAEREQLFVRPLQHASTAGQPFQLVIEEDWIASLGPDAVVSGPLPKRTLTKLAERGIPVRSDPSRPFAAAVADLAHARFAADDTDDPYKVVPLYGRVSAAEEKRAAEAIDSKTD